MREYWIVDPAHRTLEIYKHDQDNADIPHLYLIEKGVVTSTVLLDLHFDLKELFS